MANRNFIDKQYALIKREVHLYGAFLVGAAGAVTLQKWNYPTLGAGTGARTYTAAPLANALPSGAPYPLQYAAGAEGIRSVTRTGAGAWTVQLQDNYQRLMMVSESVQNATGVVTTADVGISSTITNMTANGGSIIGLQLLNTAGGAADPASGDLVLLTFILNDATEP